LNLEPRVIEARDFSRERHHEWLASRIRELPLTLTPINAASPQSLTIRDTVARKLARDLQADTRRANLEEHGATEEEIEFLATPDDNGMCQRVELNAMTSPQLLAFVASTLSTLTLSTLTRSGCNPSSSTSKISQNSMRQSQPQTTVTQQFEITGRVGRSGSFAVVKEIVDNALDAGAENVAVVEGTQYRCWIRDDGPGLASDDVPRLFAVNRPLLSSRLKRLPTRGMLGNGLRVVMVRSCRQTGSRVMLIEAGGRIRLR
jgi:hypothetical protein